MFSIPFLLFGFVFWVVYELLFHKKEPQGDTYITHNYYHNEQKNLNINLNETSTRLDEDPIIRD